MKYRDHMDRIPLFIISTPFIYGVIIPIVLLDIATEIYHRVCFKLYDIPYVERKKYIQIDRQHLKYLSTIEKINCMYCGYANGFAHYFSKICAETENYWCSIKHQKNKTFIPQIHQESFIEYGDEESLNKKYKA